MILLLYRIATSGIRPPRKDTGWSCTAIFVWIVPTRFGLCHTGLLRRASHFSQRHRVELYCHIRMGCADRIRIISHGIASACFALLAKTREELYCHIRMGCANEIRIISHGIATSGYALLAKTGGVVLPYSYGLCQWDLDYITRDCHKNLRFFRNDRWSFRAICVWVAPRDSDYITRDCHKNLRFFRNDT